MTKRKQENSLTAKAESGTLKVKILRRDEGEERFTSIARRTEPSVTDSPPRPRPNRKHVPIFYGPQFRQPIKRGDRSDVLARTTTTQKSAGVIRDDDDRSNGFQPTSLLEQSAGLSSALHQLASSSVSYRSALVALMSATRGEALGSNSAMTTATSSTSSETSHNKTTQETNDYRFDPLAALQKAIEHARNLSSTCGQPRDIVEPNGEMVTKPAVRNANTVEFPSQSFRRENLRIRDKTQRLLSPLTVNNNKTSTDDKDMIARFSNPSHDGAISIKNLPEHPPTLESLGSLTRLISQANETAKELDNALIQTQSLNKETSVVNERNETSNLKIVPSPISYPNTSSESDAKTTDLGQLPIAPPPFTIGNSLIGGGIELEPTATTVDTHNFDWKRHRSSPNDSSRTSIINNRLRECLKQG